MDMRDDLRGSLLISSLRSRSSSSSSSFPSPDERIPEFGPRLYEGIETNPFSGGYTIKEEEGRYVVTHTDTFRSARGRPIKVVEYLPINNTISSSSPIDLGLLNLLPSSSSDSSLSPPPQFPFPWAPDTGTDGVKILSVDEITSKLGIMEIKGEVECTNCHQSSTLGFDLKTKSLDIVDYVDYNSLGGYFSANHWLNPLLPACPNCWSNSPCPNCGSHSHPNYSYAADASHHLKPVIPEKDIDYKKINWLFLFLDQMLGCCSVEQLNLFCKHSTSDRLYREYCGAKNHLLYLTYVTLCNQLYPTGPLNDPKRIL